MSTVSKSVPAGIAMGKIKVAIGDLDTITSIMRAIGENMPADDVRPDWLMFFGGAINQTIERIEEAIESVA